MNNLTPSQANIITYFTSSILAIIWISYYLFIKRKNKRSGYINKDGVLKLSKPAHVFLTVLLSITLIFFVGFIILNGG